MKYILFFISMNNIYQSTAERLYDILINQNQSAIKVSVMADYGFAKSNYVMKGLKYPDRSIIDTLVEFYIYYLKNNNSEDLHNLYVTKKLKEKIIDYNDNLRDIVFCNELI